MTSHALRKFWSGPAFREACESGDGERQIGLIDAHLEHAERFADPDLYSRSLVHALRFYATHAMRSPALSVAVRLAALDIAPERDRLAVLAARWTWESLDEPQMTRLFLERALRYRKRRAQPAGGGPEPDRAARFARQEDAWHEFIETSIALGLACQEGRPDSEIEALIWKIRSFVGLGNLSQECFLKSLRLLIARRRFVHSARYLLSWVWADQIRMRRLQGAALPGDPADFSELLRAESGRGAEGRR